MQKIPFVKEKVDKSPQTAGVYILYSGESIIYIGRAQGGTTTIRSRLQRHMNGAEGVCTQRATHYSRESVTNPVEREVQLLEWFQDTHGRLPKCNARVG